MIVLATILVTTTAIQMQTVVASSSEPEIQHGKMGFYDGCHGIVVPGKHTEAYLKGYALGAKNCP